MAESDWDTVTVLRKKGPTTAQSKLKQFVLAYLPLYPYLPLSGAAGQMITKNTAKLDRETEELHHQRVSLDKIIEKPQIIGDYESGKGIPNKQVMGKIERAIGLKLRGKDIGKSLEAIPKKK
ncbi:endothelial differentiation-related factor 1 homolog isoform X2 [Coregonus clupeaformis]|uniref:endothelial differentiation-related factor 1 homolog isoform X2 n=1 Tax=Coregonus clupeaformis TaxID=59861 RepID=UPI001BE06BBF|nr:endothelial differentiation-related factor 1 homolog isoform X2 [Coregonus clupeaformis]